MKVEGNFRCAAGKQTEVFDTEEDAIEAIGEIWPTFGNAPSRSRLNRRTSTADVTRSDFNPRAAYVESVSVGSIVNRMPVSANTLRMLSIPCRASRRLF
jgi:hypothetical protein